MTVPAGADQCRSRVLFLRRERDVAVVYDPVSRDTLWAGKKVAVAGWTGLNR